MNCEQDTMIATVMFTDPGNDLVDKIKRIEQEQEDGERFTASIQNKGR